MNPEVVIIGGGFAGTNLARILQSHGVQCVIYSNDASASQMWAGTVDVINYREQDANEATSSLESERARLLHRLPRHPYALLTGTAINTALKDYFSVFPFLKASLSGNEFLNAPAITAFGTVKPCVGRWASIFGDFERLTVDSRCLLIDFVEFNTSAMDLVKAGLESRFPGKYRTVQVNFRNILAKWDEKAAPQTKIKLSLREIADAFERNQANLDCVEQEIRTAIELQAPEWQNTPIHFMFFPPVLGFLSFHAILERLNASLQTECYETIALSPSLMGTRLMGLHERECERLKIPVFKGHTFTGIVARSDGWELTFHDKKNTPLQIVAPTVVFATGSLFGAGPLATDTSIQELFGNINITIPNPLENSFQLQSQKEKPAQLYCCGSASYRFMGGLSDNEEIRYGTGLGLAISSSWQTAQDILKYHTK